MVDKSDLSIWQRRNIAPLEYCSLERACKLLECEIDDLWHWQDIGAINFAANIKEDTTFRCGIFSPDDIDCSKLSLKEQTQLQTYALISLGRNQRGIRFTYKDKPTLIGEAINVEVLCSGIFSFVNKIDRYKNKEWSSEDVCRIETNEFATVFISGTLPEEELSEKDLFILKSEVEKVHRAVLSGRFDENIFKELESQPRVTVHQSNMIVALLRIAGLSEDDIFHVSPSNLNKRISQLGASKGINVPQPDKDTWSKWRGRFR
ncbi:hypothetical protein MXM41_07855 [Leclercia adecarboxylata]|uniref:hypothetical protein n=1 Tax=Leclercia adecarboxylata TaxID=83655 RepID=UPI002DBA3883|nr:hypothetical protein [Leclercia adecarboxylata]MEB6378847.1 hypothetical protein [Leclercia adecarboxylata]